MGPFTLSRSWCPLVLLAFVLFAAGCTAKSEPSLFDPEPSESWKRSQVARFEKAADRTSPLPTSELVCSSVEGDALCWAQQEPDRVTLWWQADRGESRESAREVHRFAFESAPFELSLAPDGQRCLLLRQEPSLSHPAEQAVLELWDLSRGSFEVVSPIASLHLSPVWLDDQRIVYAEYSAGRLEVLEQALGRKAERVLESRTEFPRLLVSSVAPDSLVIYDRSAPLDTRGWYREDRKAGTRWRPFALLGQQVRLTGKVGNLLYGVVRDSPNSSQVLELPLGALDLETGKLSLDKARSVCRLGVVDYVSQVGGRLGLLCAGVWGHELKALDLASGQMRTVAFPASPGQGRRIRPLGEREVFFQYEGVFQPPGVALLNLHTSQVEILLQTPLSGIEAADHLVATGQDKVTLSARVVDASAPLLLECYGGFRQKLLPYYDPVRLDWLRRGGEVQILQLQPPPKAQHLAVSALLEAAESWQGRPVVYRGGSNGATLGLIAGLRRPELFAALWSDAGLTDMLNYTALPPGRLWLEEYGDPADPAQRERLEELSPLALLARRAWLPLTLLTTSPRDPVVDPRHSWRFLQLADDLGLGSRVYLQEQAIGTHGVLSPRLSDQSRAVDFLWKQLSPQQNR